MNEASTELPYPDSGTSLADYWPYFLGATILLIFILIVFCSLCELACCCDRKSRNKTISQRITTTAPSSGIARTIRGASINSPSIGQSLRSSARYPSKSGRRTNPRTVRSASQYTRSSRPTSNSSASSASTAPTSSMGRASSRSGSSKVAPPEARNVAKTANIIGKILTHDEKQNGSG